MKTQIAIIRSLVMAITLTALLVATSGQAAAQTEKKSLYERGNCWLCEEVIALRCRRDQYDLEKSVITNIEGVTNRYRPFTFTQ